MTHRELVVGQHYIARVSHRLVPVRLTAMEENQSAAGWRWRYHVTNLATGREVTFYSPQRFRFEASQTTVNNCMEGAAS